MAKASVHEPCTTINSKENEILETFRHLNQADQDFCHRIMLGRLRTRTLVASTIEGRQVSEVDAYAILTGLHGSEVAELAQS